MIKLTRAGISKYPVNKEVFLSENDLSFYLLGVYITDGHVVDTIHQLSFGLSSKDKDWIESIRDLVCPGKPIYAANHNNFKLASSNVEVMNWLISYGCVPRKSKIVKLNRVIPKIYQKDFIRGVLDGNGSISYIDYKKVKNNKEYFYKKTVTYICSASKTFLEQIREMIPEGINCNLVKTPKKNGVIRGKPFTATCDMFRLIFNDSNAKKFLAWIYYPNHKLSLSRKCKMSNLILAAQVGFEPTYHCVTSNPISSYGTGQ